MKIKNYYLLTALIFLGTNLASYSQTINTFFGGNSGTNNTGNYNTGFGINSLLNNTSHSNNAFGFETLINSSGGYNCAFGNNALQKNTTGSLNSAYGTRALENNTTGSRNIAIGHRSLGSNIAGIGNTALGYGALTTSTGNDNIAIGQITPRHLVTGNSNIFIGNETAVNLYNGNYNLLLGNVRLNNSATTNKLAGNNLEKTVIIADGHGNQKMLMSRGGNIGIGLGNNIIPRNRLDIGGGVVIGRGFTPSFSDFDGYLAPTNGLLVEGRVGIGNSSPKNKIEITHGTDGFSGLRFTNLTSNSVPIQTQSTDKFLTVNQFGDVIFQKVAPSNVSSNLLTSAGNTMTSNVASLISTAPIVNSISNTITPFNQLITTINGVSSVPVNLPEFDFSELDASTTNELQTISISGNTISLSNNGGSITLPTLVDTDQQSLSLIGNTLSISNGNSVVLPTYVDTNTDQQSLSLTDNTLSISNGNSVVLPTFVDTNTDEQSLSLTGNTLSISNGNSVMLPIYTDKDAQSLTLNGNILSISNGNSVTIPTLNFANGTNTTISGNGTVSNPFQINTTITDTSIYANNGVINQATTVNNNRIVDMNNSNIWFNSANSTTNGNIYIGDSATYPTNTGDYKLYVEGGILTEKVKVALRSTANWADYVFADNYELMPLKDVEKFINSNKHLPGIKSAKELMEDGLDVAQMQAKHMEKIEELTLYVIEQEKKINEQNLVIQKYNSELELLKKQVNALIEKTK
ncbi:beta strand repeat-containing protein [Flavobacterium macrobrachii]|uniref:beta strand repeat-containing protein n=1 Tax=Flavobacterium macrobrachii TaxID=591204 RepID=UPI003F6FB6BC